MIKWVALSALALFSLTLRAEAFCGFYVSQADGDLFNNASKVAIARKEGRTVVTMANDYTGELSDFAIVIPVPTVINRDQVHVTTPDALNALDAFSAPRLVEYYDENPCAPEIVYAPAMDEDEVMLETVTVTASKRAEAFGVTIEDSYTVGEYDILILSAIESDGLLRWLSMEGYNLPNGAERTIQSYIRQDMKFFVAKVNLEEQSKSEGEYLSPIAIAYEDDNFMLPIRLGTLNADGSQDLIVFALTAEGRVETVNYKTRKIPTDKDVPLYLKEAEGEFGEFYKALFERSVKRAGGSGVFLEYFFNIRACDPCSAPPPTQGQMFELGVWWGDGYDAEDMADEDLRFETLWDNMGEDLEEIQYEMNSPFWGDTYLTRLHVRYDAKSFPEDLLFQETGDDDYFQGRYVVNVPWRGEADCEAARGYAGDVIKRQRKEISNVANLTGWKHRDIEAKARANGDIPFTFDPKPEVPIIGDEAEARELYEQFFWWRGFFPPVSEDDEREN
ncbi:MAG: DUF2330 domain-containing protein [Pseudomonadota bacterium]